MTEIIISAQKPIDVLSREIKKSFSETEIHESFKLKPDWSFGSIYVRKETRDTCSAETADSSIALPFWTRKPVTIAQLLQGVVFTILKRNLTQETA